MAMSGQPTNPGADEIRERAWALHDISVTPAKSLAVRAHVWSLLADVLVSDYLNRWNGAGAHELAQAEQAMNEALKIDPTLAVAHHANGFIHRARGKHQEAHDAFHRTLSHDPDFARAYAQKGNELM